MLNIYCNKLVAVCFSHQLWRAVEKGASPRFTDLSPQPNSDQPSACSGEIQSAQSKFEIAKYGKSAGRSEKAEEKKEANLEGPATSPQNRQTLQLGGKGVKQRCEKHCLRPRCWVLTSTAWVCSNLELTFWKVGRYLQTCTHYSTGAGLRPWRSSR